MGNGGVGNGGASRQRSSFFYLRSADAAWPFVALDTGLHADDPFEQHPITSLDPTEEQWAVDRIAEFPGRTILLSHHPLFSALAQIGPGGPDPWRPALRDSFARFAAAGRIAAWFWGHGLRPRLRAGAARRRGRRTGGIPGRGHPPRGAVCGSAGRANGLTPADDGSDTE